MMTEKAALAFREHSIAEYNDGLREACGYLVMAGRKQVYVPAVNVADDPQSNFRTDAASRLRAEQLGTIIGVCHSHPNGFAQPTPADRAGCEAAKLPYYIFSWPDGQLARFEPSGYRVPLIGREFVHGMHDCYGLARDYYQQTLAIELPDFERELKWWDIKNEDGTPKFNLLEDHFADAGFAAVPLKQIQEHDIILMQVFGAPVACHCGVYIGNTQMLHQLSNQLSCRVVYGGYWRKCTRYVVRHARLM